MRCPHCDVALHMSERQGVEIDYCPECRGVWLDRGELDKIIERSHDELVGAAAAPAPTPAMAPPPGPARTGGDRPRDDDRYRGDRDDRHRDDRHRDGDRPRYDDRQRDDDRDRRDPRYDKKKKRKSFLEDIFDF